MTKIDTTRPETVLPTPSHTVGPFYGYALPFHGGGDIAPVGHPDTITLHGTNGTWDPSRFENFEQVVMGSGTTTLSGAWTPANGLIDCVPSQVL